MGEFAEDPTLHWLEMYAMAPANYDAPLAAELKLDRGLDGQERRAAGALHVDEDRRAGGLFHRCGEGSSIGEPAQRSYRGTVENFCLLGNGSNVLISDRGVRGAVIHLAGEFKQAQWREKDDTPRVDVGAARAPWRNWCAKRRAKATRVWNLPKDSGRRRRRLFMNAGAFGSEFEKVVDQVEGDKRQAASHFIWRARR
jgi:hypothetical protein